MTGIAANQRFQRAVTSSAPGKKAEKDIACRFCERALFIRVQFKLHRSGHVTHDVRNTTRRMHGGERHVLRPCSHTYVYSLSSLRYVGGCIVC